MNDTYSRQRNFMVALVSILALILVGSIAWKLASGDGNNELTRTQSTNSDPQTDTTGNDKPKGTDDGYSQRNIKRKNDASILSSMVANYQADNQGKLPTAYVDNALSGDEGDTPIQDEGLSQYNTVTVMSGEQPALSSDVLALVTGAQCSDAGATLAGSSRESAIQYMQETADGTFTPACMTT